MLPQLEDVVVCINSGVSWKSVKSQVSVVMCFLEQKGLWHAMAINAAGAPLLRR